MNARHPIAAIAAALIFTLASSTSPMRPGCSSVSRLLERSNNATHTVLSHAAHCNAAAAISKGAAAPARG